MNENYFDPEDEYFWHGEEDVILPPAKEIERIIFVVSYLFSDLWNKIVNDIYDNGYHIGSIFIPTEDMLDAIRIGLFIPIYSHGSDPDDESIYFKLWSPIEHKYCDLNEMSIYEIYWFFHFLVKENLEL